MSRSKIFSAALLMLAAAALHGDYPTIKRLANDDILFRQFHEDIERYNIASTGGLPPPPLLLYRYTPAADDNIFTVASRLTLPYDSLATLNGIENSAAPVAGVVLLIPSVPGLFLRDKPASQMERIMRSWRKPEEGIPITVGASRFFFFPGERFHPVERAFFLNILFAFPLDAADITSRYGTRISPISGRIHFHNGLDLAAPKGSRVLAARDGRVALIGSDPMLGRNIVVAHSGGYETLYGHLDSVLVELNQSVTSGMIIGRVGTTGASTGAHLHFEVRKQGEARDPEGLLPRWNKP